MQLLDSIQTQLEAGVTERLLDILEDIVHKVEIQPDFSIHHPDYKPLEVPTEVVARFQKLPEQMQKKYLSLQLRSFLYGIYYNGSLRSSLALDGEGNAPLLDLENNTLLGIDLAFYKRLHESNCGKGYFDPKWSILREESDGSLAVSKGGLSLHIKRDKHLQASENAVVVGDSVAVRMPKNLVQNGFYVAVGNLGLSHLADAKGQQITVRI